MQRGSALIAFSFHNEMRDFSCQIKELSRSQIKARYTNAGEGAEKRELSYTVGGNVKWYNHYGEQYGVSLRN